MAEPDTVGARAPGSIAALAAVVAVAWLAAWLVRLRLSVPFADDWLDAGLGLRLWRPLTGLHLGATARAFLSTGSNAPLLPALAAPLSGLGPDIAVLAQLPLLLALAWVAHRILARFLDPWPAVAGAAVACLLPSTLAWSVMLSPALPAALFSLAALGFALESDGLRRRAPSLAFGTMLGLLALSRSMAPAYIAAVVAALALAHVLARAPRPGRAQAVNALLAGGLALALAGPWWLASGRAAMTYLLHAGYSTSSSYTQPGNPLVERLTWTAGDWGLVTVLLLLAGAGLVLRGPRVAALNPARRDAIRVLGLFGGLVLAGLATTTNQGTGFALPALLAWMVALALALAPRGPAWRAWTGAAAAVAALGVLQMTAGAAARGDLLTRWIPNAPYKALAEQALGRPLSAADHTVDANALVVSAVGAGSVWVIRDDALVGSTSLDYVRLRRGLGRVGVAAHDRGQVLLPPRGYTFVITGTSCAPYHLYDEATLETELGHAGYHPVDQLDLSPCNRILIWSSKS